MYPKIGKIANVTPIYKKGDKSVALNYRSISLTSVAGKILEKIMRDKLVNILEENNIISDAQHGFRNKHSCLTNLLDFFQGIYDNWEEVGRHLPNGRKHSRSRELGSKKGAEALHRPFLYPHQPFPFCLSYTRE